MTYAGLAVLFVLVSALPLAVAVVRRRPDARWWLRTAVTAAGLVVLTAVFDSLMIAADLFRYDEGVLSGVRVGLAPIEDFAWPLAAALLVPSVALLLTPRPQPEEVR